VSSNFPPRPRNTLGFSLGAVGGSKGTGAGAARVLIQFAAQYDRGDLQQLGRDLQQLQAQQQNLTQQTQAALVRQGAIENEINRAKQGRSNLDQTGLRAMKSMLDIQARARAEEAQLGRITQATSAELLRREATFRRVSGLSALEVAAIRNQHANQIALNTAKGATIQAQTLQAANEQKINAVMQQGVAIATARAQLAAQLRGLFLGAVGGVIGGAVVGAVLYEPLQNFVTGIKDSLGELVDPAAAAEEAIDKLGNEVNELASSENISRLQAAQQILDKMGGGDAGDAQNLSLAGEVEVLQKAVETGQQRLDLEAGVASAREDAVTALARQEAIERAIGDNSKTLLGNRAAELRFVQQIADLYAGFGFTTLRDALDASVGTSQEVGENLAGAALEADRLSGNSEDSAAAIQAAADAAADLRSELASANIQAVSEAAINGIQQSLDATVNGIRNGTEAAIDGIRQRAESAADAVRNSADRRIDAIQNRMRALEVVESRRTRNLQAALDALEDAGPSKRTRELAEQIERVNDAQEKAAFKAQLGEIADRKREILLRERLRLSDEEIDLDRYKGKDRIIAIDALLDRMRKQNEEQSRFNQLLDIQYQISQGVRRQQGETIQDFIQRRAQYYRGLLQQAAELQREGPMAELEQEKHRVEVGLELRELEQRRKKLIEDRARAQYLESLQEQLQASRERDQRELENRREMLQKQLQESRAADQAGLDSRRQALQAQIEAVRRNAEAEIESINSRRDKEINARQAARDRAIQLAQETAQKAIEAERKRAEMIGQWADYGEAQRMIQAFQGARSVAELQAFSGSLSGALYSLNYLKQSGQWMGLDPGTQQVLLRNLSAAVQAYSRKMISFAPRPQAPPRMGGFGQGLGSHGSFGGSGGGYQRGGAFMLRNSMQSPFADNIRFGEDGLDEIGLILNNKILRQLQDNKGGGQALFGGDMIIQSHEDPYKARYAFRQEVRAIVREELR
jgi:hypothetical protein